MFYLFVPSNVPVVDAQGTRRCQRGIAEPINAPSRAPVAAPASPNKGIASGQGSPPVRGRRPGLGRRREGKQQTADQNESPSAVSRSAQNAFILVTAARSGNFVCCTDTELFTAPFFANTS